MIISIDTEKKFWQVHDKDIQQTRDRRELPQPNKGHLQKTPQLILDLMEKDN